MTQLHIFLDVDGVLADWTAGVCRLARKDPEEVYANWQPGEAIHDQLGITKSQMWRAIETSGERFWANLDPLPWARDLWALCNEYAPTTILTSPSLDPACLAGKLRWLNYHLGDGKAFRDYLIGPNKYVVAGPGKLLIDDHARNCDKFVEAGGASIVFPTLHAGSGRYDLADLDGLDDPLAYVAERLEHFPHG